MKKVINITLGGVVFSAEEDAYEKLSAYLRDVEQHFADNPDREEIVSDIEQSMGEKFSAKVTDKKNALSLEMVAEVIKEMGTTEDFEEAEPANGDSSGKKMENDEAKTKSTKRLYRNTDDAVLGGVASGLGAYFDLDPVVVRIAFVLMAFLHGFGLLAYVILWIAVPKALTTSQKFEMRGEPMTLSQIESKFKEGVERVKGLDGKDAETALSFFRKLFAFCGKAIRIIFSVGLRVLGGFFMFVSGIVMMSLLFGFVVITFGLGTVAVNPVAYAVLSGFFLGGVMGFFFSIGTFLVIFLPFLLLFMFGLWLLRRKHSMTAGGVGIVIGLWITMLFVTLTLGLVQAPDVKWQIETVRHASYNYF